MTDGRDNTAGRASGLSVGLALVAGAAIDVGLGLLFAPKSGAALRRDIARRAREIQDGAADQYERAAEAAHDLAGRGRETAQRARAAVATGIREARRYANDVADAAADTLDG
jgi:gas vesicle protein